MPPAGPHPVPPSNISAFTFPIYHSRAFSNHVICFAFIQQSLLFPYFISCSTCVRFRFPISFLVIQENHSVWLVKDNSESQVNDYVRINDFRYHEVKHTNYAFEDPVDSLSLAQRACSMRMERQSGNGMGTERLVKDNGTRG